MSSALDDASEAPERFIVSSCGIQSDGKRVPSIMFVRLPDETAVVYKAVLITDESQAGMNESSMDSSQKI